VTDLLRALAARLGPAPRRIDGELAQAMALPPAPPWLEPGHALEQIRRDHALVVERGRLAPAVLFMANTVLYEPGEADAPAAAVYSFDPAVAAFPGKLRRAGERLFAFHEFQGDPPTDPWQRQLVAALDTGMAWPQHLRVPPELCEGHAMFVGSVMLYRAHLPGGWLADARVPLLVGPSGMDPRSALVVPGALWPSAWRTRWQVKEAGS